MTQNRITRLRVTFMAVLAGALTLAGAGPALASSANQFPNGRIADVALTHRDGSPGGQCYVFVNNALAAASGGRVHIGGSHTYFGAYARAGGVLVTSAQAQRGDIIQISNPRNDNVYYPGMHTAIVVSNLRGGNFDVVDSNWGYAQLVHHHHLNPYKLIVAGTGESVQFWRMGQVTPVPITPTPITPTPTPVTNPPQPPAPVTNNTFPVYGLPAGNTLNVRSGPGAQFPVIGSLNEGQLVTVGCQAAGSQVVGSNVWDQIRPGAYVADWFVRTPVVGFTSALPRCA